MRLIDADKVIPIGLENKTIRISDTELPATQEREFALTYLFEDLWSLIDSQPTTDVIDNIKKELKEKIDDYHETEDFRRGCYYALYIVNKYMKEGGIR